MSAVTLEAVLSSNTFCTGVGGFSTAKPDRRQPRTFGVVGGSYWRCGFVDEYLSHMQERVCTCKTLSGVTAALNRGLLYLCVQANLLGGREEKLHCCAFYSEPWSGIAEHRQFL